MSNLFEPIVGVRLFSKGLWVLLLTCLPCLAADKQQIRFSHISLNDEDISGSVTHIIQDRHGFMWFAAGEGLFRYDGYDYDVFKPERESSDGLTSRPTVLLEDRDGFIWIGTLRTGLFRIDPARGTFTSFVRDPNDPRSLQNNNVHSLLEDRMGRLWVGTNSGLHRMDRDKRGFTNWNVDRANANSLSDHRVWSLAEAEDGAIWVGTKNGLNRFDPVTENVTRYLHDGKRNDSLSQNSVYALCFDTTGNLWVGTRNGLNYLDMERQSFTVYRGRPANSKSLSDNSIRALLVTRSGQLWVGTRKGLNLFDKESHGFHRYLRNDGMQHSLSRNQIGALFEDRSGVLWVGTRGGGINKFDPIRQRFQHQRTLSYEGGRQEAESMLAIKEDEAGVLWTGSFDGGLTSFDPVTKTVTRYRHDESRQESLGENTVTAIELDGSGGLWLGTNKGLDHWNPLNDQFTHHLPNSDRPGTLSSNEVTVLLRDRDGTLWVGGNGGLDRLDVGTGLFRHYRPDLAVTGNKAHRQVQTLLLDSCDRLWVGTKGGGLYRLDPGSEAFHVFRTSNDDPTTLPGNDVTSLYEDRSGVIWIGANKGLARFVEVDDTFDRFGLTEGLKGSRVLGLLGDRFGYLWMSTDVGLSRFDPRSNQFNSYDFTDERSFNEFNQGAFAEVKDGRLFFGGVNGYHSFFPATFNEEKIEPIIALTDFRILNDSVKVSTEEVPTLLTQPIYKTDKIILDYVDDMFSFEFAVLDYADPNKNRYAYRLLNFNDDWIFTEARNRFATYTRLAPGEYVFEANGANKDGTWSKEGVSLNILILPPFWLTWWFKTLEVLAVFTLMAALFSAQRNHINRKKNAELHALEEKRHQKEALHALELKRKTEELEFARQVQLSMLPDQDIDSDSVEIVGRMRTASEVGGDYYDFIPLADERMCVVCGDATGHGVTSGLIVGMTRSSLITLLQNSSSKPIELIRNLNKALRMSITQKYIGMGLALGLWDARARKLELSSAGMPFPYHYIKAERRVDLIALKCPPLGFLRQLPVNEHSLKLNSGDAVIWLSDGFAERTNPKGVYWGLKTLHHEIATICETSVSARQIAEEILARCDAYAEGCENEDDMTVVVLRVK